jgi:DNA-binding NtrC family response regulator
LLTSDVVRPEHLAGVYTDTPLASFPAAPDAPPGGLSLKEVADTAAQQAERQAIREALRASGGNKSETARRLKVDYKTLHIKMKQYGIHARDSSS